MSKGDKIRFRDLSIVLKLGIIGGIIALIFYVLSFLIGFIQGLLGITII